MSKKTEIEWRRHIVLQRLAMGYNQTAIARELQLHPSTISLDCQYLKIKARQEVKEFIEKLPFMVMKSTMALNLISEKTWQLIELTDDVRSKIQGLSLLKDVERQKVELYSSTDIIDALVGAVEKRKEQVATVPVMEQQQEVFTEKLVGIGTIDDKDEDKKESAEEE